MYSEYCNGSQDRVFNIAKPVCEPDDRGDQKKHLSAFSPEIIIIKANFTLCHFCKREDIVDHVRHTAVPRHQHKHTLTPQITASNKAGGRKEPRFLQTLDHRRLHFLHCVSWGGKCVTSFLWCRAFNWFKRSTGATWANPSNFYEIKLQWTHDSLLSFQLSSIPHICHFFYTGKIFGE